jgi:tetratricopeptide (TPR) repeat protein
MIKRVYFCLAVTGMQLFICGLSAAQTEPKVRQINPGSANKGENEETLFNTLNEALEENRKVRIAMKELQQALQQKTIESEDLKSELRKLESLALERNRELGQKVKDLDAQIKTTNETAAKFELEKDEFTRDKKRIKDEMRASQMENSKLRKMLANSVLQDEEDAILQTARENSEVAKKAQERVIQLNTENQTFKNDIATVYYQMGNVLFQVKRYPEAAEAYKKVIAYDPSNSWSYHNLAVIEDYYLNDPTAAYEHYQLYLNYKPADEDAQEVRRRILDLNMLDKIAPMTPLKKDFDKFHQESTRAKL